MSKLGRYTFSLDPLTVKRAKSFTYNLSATVNTLLEKFSYEATKADFISSLKKYEIAAQERRRRLGIFR